MHFNSLNDDKEKEREIFLNEIDFMLEMEYFYRFNRQNYRASEGFFLFPNNIISYHLNVHINNRVIIHSDEISAPQFYTRKTFYKYKLKLKILRIYNVINSDQLTFLVNKLNLFV